MLTLTGIVLILAIVVPCFGILGYGIYRTEQKLKQGKRP
jgi:hypothetical protein